MSQSELLSGLISLPEVNFEGGFGLHEQICTRVRYEPQENSYLTQVLDLIRTWAQSRGMVIPLKEAREAAGISQEKLGLSVNSGRSTIVKLENGVLPLTQAWAIKLAPKLGLAINQKRQPAECGLFCT